MSMFHELMMKKKGMPSRYQEVEYIESTGTQYIDTGIKAQEGMEFICEVAFTDLSSGRFGSGTSLGYRYYFGVNNSYFIGANSTAYNHSIMSADTNKHSFKLNDNGLYIDDNLVYSSVASYPSETQAINIFLFKSNTTVDFSAKCKNYSSIIKINGAIIRNFIPVYDTETQKYGMWESVQGKFYGNDGTGDFKGSIVGYTVVGSPTITDGVVSGFSTSDYIQISNFPYTSDSFEINIKATTTNTGLQQRCLYRSVNFQLRVSSSFEWELYVNGINTPLGQNPSSYPYVRIKKGSVISVYLSQDGITYSKVADNIAIGSVTDGTLTFSSTGNIWSGSIDMNDTNIYKNNKLWFNGQQA